jgi:hypothetical protein
MKYKVKIPLANYPDTRTHDKEFDNILDVIDYFKAIINDEIEDDWNCHIDEAKGLQYLIKNKLENSISKEYFDSLKEEYNEIEMVDYMFYTYVTIIKPICKKP